MPIKKLTRTAQHLAASVTQAVCTVAHTTNNAWLPPLDSSLFFHAPSGNRKSWITSYSTTAFKALHNHSLHSNPCKLEFDTDIHLLTYSNYDSPTLLEECLTQSNVPVHVLARSVEVWDWSVKVTEPLAWLEKTSLPDDSLVVLLDANDVVPYGLASNLRSRFDQYKCDVLFCGTPCNWPQSSSALAFENEVNAPTGQHHLSAGGFMGFAGALKDYLSELSDAYSNRSPWACSHPGTFDDQLAWRTLHMREYPKIQVDIYGTVFQRYDSRRWWRGLPSADAGLSARASHFDVDAP